MIILSYHDFDEKEKAYQYSRTYEQFKNDIKTKQFDMITMDDCLAGQLKALEILQDQKIRAKVAVTTGFVGNYGYLTWKELKEISKHHDIVNHSHLHINLQTLDEQYIRINIKIANDLIKEKIGYKPKYFVPPYNKLDERVERISAEEGLEILKDRVTILNITE